MAPPKLKPPVYVLMALIAMACLHYFVPISRYLSSPFSYVGLVPLIVGVGIAFTAVRAFARAGTPLVPFETSTVVVKTGLYRLTRNPMYLGMVLALVGVALLLGSVASLAPIPVFAWFIGRYFIRPEEVFLEGLFGAEYLEYKAQVRRWL